MEQELLILEHKILRRVYGLGFVDANAEKRVKRQANSDEHVARS